MSLRKDRGVPKIITAGLVLLLVQMACSGTTSADPRIPEALNSMVSQFDPLLAGLQVIPLGGLRPPLITQITSDSVSGLGSIGSSGSSVLDASGAGATELSSYKIRLYRMELQGCGQEPTQGQLLAEAPIDFGGTWSINYRFNSGDVVGATQVSEGNESGLSNMKVNVDQSQFLTLNNADKLQQSEYEISKPLILIGESFPGACIVLQNQDGRVGSVTVPGEGNEMEKWTIEVSVKEGENSFKLFVKGWDEITYVLNIRGILPQMQWPYIIKDKNKDTCRFLDKEAQVDGCYYLAPITGWYGPNDLYKANNLGGGTGFHDGIDIGGSSTDEVHAVAKGEVFYIQISDSNGGNVVLIDHGTWFSVYMHLSKITVDCLKLNLPTKNCPNPTKSKYFDTAIQVEAGDIIGITGSTGAESVHLHFSAFRWKNNNRKESLGKNRSPAWPWSPYGEALNVNPPGDKILGNEEKAANRLADLRLSGNPKYYYLEFDYWLVDWSEVRIREYACKGTPIGSGTRFDELIFDTATKKWKCQ